MVSEITFSSLTHSPLSAEPRHLARRFKPACDADLHDVQDDAQELKHLIDDLARLFEAEQSPASSLAANLTESWFSRGFFQTLQQLKAQLSVHIDKTDRTKYGTSTRRGHSVSQQSAALDAMRHEFLQLKSAVRVAYRHRGTLLCDADWQSPVYAASTTLESNRLTQGIKEHVLDYKRDGHLDSLPYEEEFVQQYARHLGSANLHAYLTSCGMSAFTGIMGWLVQELKLGASALAIEPMYFENLHLSKSFLPEVMRLSAPARQELLTTLRVQRPSLIICDAVTNCGAVLEHDIQTIIKWAAEEATHTVALVIDTTCLPSVLLPSDMLANLPDNILVALVESLAKHHQFGMDTVTGGVIMLHASEALHGNFKKTRARNGVNIADTSVGSLPRPNRLRLTRRLQRHARNLHALVNRLQKEIGAGIIESISWLEKGVACAPWFNGSCFNLNLRPQFRSIEKYRQFEELVLKLAAERSLPITLGTSFGFDVTRLYVTAPATVFEPPFLRVSLGTETASQIDALAEIMNEASFMLARQWETQAQGNRADSAPTAPAQLTVVAPRFPVREKPGLAESVHTGEDALHKYLSPENFPATPLVELPGDLNPYRSEGIRLFAKIMPLVPLMNIKSIPAYAMLAQAAERGDLDGVQKVIESSSSNTVLSLSVLAKLFGIDTTYAIVDHNIAPSLARMLRLFGIEILTHAGIGHELYGKLAPRSERATAIGAQDGWFNPGQYTNPDNPTGFAQFLAPDLWAQTEGKLDVLSCGLGTCGTMVGVSRALREYKADMQIVACCPIAGDAVPGPRERSQLKDVTFPWQDVANANIELTADESFKASIKLLRRGIMGGPSSGMNYAGLLRYIEQEREGGLIFDALRKQGEVWCTFLCCDSPLPHVDEYYDALGESFFPAVHPVPTLDQPLHEPYASR